MKKVYKVANTDFSIMNLNKERFFTSYRKALDFINETCGGINMIYIPCVLVCGEKSYRYLYKEFCSKDDWNFILKKHINGSKFGHTKNGNCCSETYKIIAITVE